MEPRQIQPHVLEQQAKKAVGKKTAQQNSDQGTGSRIYGHVQAHDADEIPGGISQRLIDTEAGFLPADQGA